MFLLNIILVSDYFCFRNLSWLYQYKGHIYDITMADFTPGNVLILIMLKLINTISNKYGFDFIEIKSVYSE